MCILKSVGVSKVSIVKSKLIPLFEEQRTSQCVDDYHYSGSPTQVAVIIPLQLSPSPPMKLSHHTTAFITTFKISYYLQSLIDVQS